MSSEQAPSDRVQKPSTGRPRSEEVHRHFTKITSDGSGYAGTRARCNHCNYESYYGTTRLAKHLEKCAAFRRLYPNAPPAYTPHPNTENRASSNSSTFRPPSLSSHELDLAFARAIIEDGRSLSLFDTPAMRAAFKALAPSYTPPTRTKMDDLVEEIYQETQAKVNNIDPQLLPRDAFLRCFLPTVNRYERYRNGGELDDSDPRDAEGDPA